VKKTPRSLESWPGSTRGGCNYCAELMRLASTSAVISQRGSHTINCSLPVT